MTAPHLTILTCAPLLPLGRLTFSPVRRSQRGRFVCLIPMDRHQIRYLSLP